MNKNQISKSLILMTVYTTQNLYFIALVDFMKLLDN